MKKVLYISNIEVPYRARFFNELAKSCDLTVLYERKKSATRDSKWSTSIGADYRIKYLKGKNIGNENAFSFGILKELKGYDRIIIGCYNSPVQMLAILYMRLLKIPYYLNIDGEIFAEGKGIKNQLKRFFLRGAEGYFAAGEKSAESLRKIVGDKTIIPYYFSSLSAEEIEINAAFASSLRNNTILVVGQYFDYKGMDIVLLAAKKVPELQFKFIGMGSRTELFLQENEISENVEVIPFLQKKELEEEYKHCGMLVLPSRQECWGLVINEAASFGMPIVSTSGSGAAAEFLADQYPEYLAEPGDADSLLNCIRSLIETTKKEEYIGFLLEKSKKYTIESGVEAHLKAL